MNKEQLLERKQLLEQDLEKYQAFTNQVMGAIEDCNFWLNQLDGADNTAPEPDESLKDAVKGTD